MVVEAGECLGGVFQRVCVANASMVLLAVWFPSRRRFLLLHVGRNQSAMVCETLEKAGSVFPLTIGMLADTLNSRDMGLRGAACEVSERLGLVKVGEISDTPVNV